MKAVDLTRTGQDCTHCRNMLVASILWPMKMFLAKTETNLCCTWWRLHHRDWNKSLRGLAPLYLAKLYRPVFHLIGRWSRWSANLTCNRQPQPLVAISGPETWNSLPAELHLSTLSVSTATFAWHLNDMCLQHVWFYLRLRCLQISLLLLLLKITVQSNYIQWTTCYIINCLPMTLKPLAAACRENGET